MATRTKAVDLDEFEVARHKGATCAMSTLELSTQQDEKLLAALARKDITSAQIARVLKTWGQSVSAHSVSRHRRKDCRCAA